MTKPTYDELCARISKLEAERAIHKQVPYERFFQNAAMGMLHIDQQLRIVGANRQALRILGYSHDELTQMSSRDLIHPDDINAQPIISAADLAHSDRVMTLERHYLCKDGRYIPVEVNLCAFTSETLIAMFRDISVRQRADEALRKANEALEVIYHSAQAAIVGMDRQMRVMFWNPAAEKMFGWPRQEVLGKPYPAVPEGQRELFDQYFKRVMEGQTFDYFELSHQRKDGALFYAVSTTGPLRDDKKEVIGLISYMFNITERKQAEQALQQSEQRYRSLVENTQDGYFVIDLPTGRFLFLNQRICQLLGYTRPEGLALSLWDVIATEDHGLVREAVERWQKSQKVTSIANIYRVRRKDGTTFRAEISGAVVTFDDRPAMQGLLRDITEKERLQQQLQQAQRMDSIGTLAGGVAHDFNNLLMAIMGNATLAKVGVSLDHPAYERIDNVVNYVKDASALTKQLLEFARGGKYEVKATDLNQLVEKTATMFGRTKKEIAVHTLLFPELWTVEVDRGQIEQVLLNLLVNAWQAMPEGGQILIQTTNERLDSAYCDAFNIAPGNYACVSVTDTGIGMDKEIQSKIFEPFFSTKDRSRGTGLGLASAYGIVKNHEGTISVYSEKGKGAKFNIYLPAVEKPVEMVEEKIEAETVVGSENILLVDDELMILDIGKAMLAELGYHPLVARSGQDALAIFAKEKAKIDLVILDMIMPVMGGGDTYDRLKVIDSGIKVLLASGYSLSGEATQILNRGCNGFIQKPFNLEELSRKIRMVLDSGKE
ncbi:MAG: PAS domain S-box protein [Desulfatitalea sp.]